MEYLKDILNDLIGINKGEWLEIKSFLQHREFKAKSPIIRAGEVARHIYFIDSGILRTYHINEGKEISTYFACDQQFISTFSSFITQSPSFEYLEAIEDSSVFRISYESLNTLYKKNSKFEKIGRILAEKNYLCVLERTLSMQTKTAKEKYQDFMNTYDKKILTRVPQHMIASFLGVAPESLSRIRREMLIS